MLREFFCSLSIFAFFVPTHFYSYKFWYPEKSLWASCLMIYTWQVLDLGHYSSGHSLPVLFWPMLKECGSCRKCKRDYQILKVHRIGQHILFHPYWYRNIRLLGIGRTQTCHWNRQKSHGRNRGKNSAFFLFQSISIAIQRGNASCILGTVPHSEGLDEIFEFICSN